jgi:pimeloyl-ACP methyl ester carboxylesterase
MRSIGQYLRAALKLLALGAFGVLLIALRYVLKTPQPLDNALPGDDRLYKWTHGHIFYKVAGAADAPPAVLLHAPEIGASSYEMRNLIEGLAQRYRVYAPDLLGFGLSDHPKLDYTADTYVTLYRDFLTQVVGQPALLLASGLSCNYAVALAADEPDLCKGLILLSPVSLFTQRQGPGWLWQLTQNSFIGITLYSLLTPRPVLRQVIARQHGTDAGSVSNEELDHVSAATHQFGAQHAGLAFVEGKLGLDVSHQLEKLQQPVLLIWGAAALEQVQPLLSQQTLPEHTQTRTIQDAGTQVHQQCAGEVLASIQAWQQAEAPATSVGAGRTRTAANAQQHVETAPAAPAIPLDRQSKPPVAPLPDEPVAAPPATEITPASPAENKQPEAVSSTDEIAAPSPVESEALTPAAPTNESVAASLIESEPPVADVTIDELPAPSPPENEMPAVAPVESEAVAENTGVDAELAEAYCVKCKQKRAMQNPHRVVTKKGRSALEGTCPVCSTKLFRFIAG